MNVAASKKRAERWVPHPAPGCSQAGVSRLFNAITVGLRSVGVKGRSKSNAAVERSAGKPWRELTAVESVNRSQSLALVDQCSEFVGCVLDQIEHGFRVFQDLSHNNENALVLRPKLVMSIGKSTNGLVVVEAAGRRTQIRTCQKRYVKARSIGAIDERSHICDSDKCLSAVRALNGVSLQRRTPIVEAISAKKVSERGMGSEKSKVTTVLREARCEPAVFTSINRPNLFACLEQVRKFVSCFFDLAKYFFRAIPRAQDEYDEDVVCGRDLIVGVHEVTHELPRVKATRQSGARIWTGQQRQVEARLIGSINPRNLLTHASENSSAVRTLIGVPLQAEAPSSPAMFRRNAQAECEFISSSIALYGTES
jgi:hypothetical protein